MFILMIWILCAVACYKMAEKRNRDTTAWAIAGALFGVFAIIMLAILGDA